MQLFNLFIRVIYERRRGMEIEEIYKVYINDVYRYLFSFSRSHHVAEDLMQETFYRAYLHLEDYENQKVKSGLFKVAYHTFICFYAAVCYIWIYVRLDGKLWAVNMWERANVDSLFFVLKVK
ncbi:RNA polymerase sigma-70 factor, ECF subfamily [Bacillus cereus AH1271]|nr:RNA polymerase sigma-70 factor, ECF subfamily [Bacillus cereus AH1271]